jgi:hypothetical protein
MRRYLLALAMSAGLLGSVPAVASAETFVPVRLTVWDTEDWTGADEVEMRYDRHVWYSPLNTFQTGFPDAKAFNGSMSVEAWDLDSGNWMDPHDFIGAHTVHAYEKVLGERSVNLRGHGADYELVYRIEN